MTQTMARNALKYFIIRFFGVILHQNEECWERLVFDLNMIRLKYTVHDPVSE
eukprot:CAMPEP_0202697434 /NCGR_PEP_ID=MMETSP1385-20130828/10769_1 /ASSEMBLY_ACC=CAM_ASM_000861 /TAXON_ID=933848 /ORGANISM="Elphidium margaritaceum" /LENGTH=51 /DNA_ID=CAMNT_0049353895 /DNA_START=265 /DNA_END=417 /DNA_ORIENTATION=-